MSVGGHGNCEIFFADNANRLCLRMTGAEDSDYINASFVDVRGTAMITSNHFCRQMATNSVKAS